MVSSIDTDSLLKLGEINDTYFINVYLLQAPTSSPAGSLKWSYTTGEAVYSSPALSADGSTVYVGSADAKVYALNALTGSVTWSYTTGGGVSSSPALSADGSTVYVGSQDYKVYALNAATPTTSPTQVCCSGLYMCSTKKWIPDDMVLLQQIKVVIPMGTGLARVVLSHRRP